MIKSNNFTVTAKNNVARIYLPEFDVANINSKKNTYLIFEYEASQSSQERGVIVTNVIKQNGEKQCANKQKFQPLDLNGEITVLVFKSTKIDLSCKLAFAINFGKFPPEKITIKSLFILNDSKEFHLNNQSWHSGISASFERVATPESPFILEDNHDLSLYLKKITQKKKDESRKVLMIVGNGIQGDSRVLKSASSIQSAGYRVVLLGVRKQSTDFEAFSLDGIDCITTHNLGLGLNISLEAHEKTMQQVAFRLAAVYQLFQPDVLYTHDYWGLDIGAHILLQNYYRHYCYWIHDIHEYIKGYEGVIEPDRLNYAIKVEKEKIKIPDKLVIVNKAIANLLCEEYGIDVTKAIILPNVPRTQSIIPGYSLRKKLGIDAKTPLGVYLGRATKLRGLDSLLHLLENITNLHIVLFSSSLRQYTNDLKARADSKGIGSRLHVFDYVPDQEVAFACKEADFGLSPLQKYGNSDLAVPTKVYEYIHAELPIIASDTVLQKKFLAEHQIGLTYSNDSADSGLLEAVHHLLQTTKLRESFKKNCQALKPLFTWNTAFAPILEFMSDWHNFPEIPESSRGIFQGPMGSAGQPSMIAAGLRSLGVASQAICIHRHAFEYPTDIVWPATTKKSKASILAWCSHRFDIFHFHFSGIFNFIENNVYVSPSFNDFLILKALQKKIIFQFRGSEVRLNAKFKQVNPFAWSEDEDPSAPKMNDETKKELLGFVRATADKVLVVDPELKTYVPDAVILERAFDIKNLRTETRNLTNLKNKEKIKIVHAPSRRRAKGTEAILNAVNKLRLEGFVFDFELLENKSNREVLDVVQSADLLIDQLVIGWYGVLAVEAMAAGVPVIAYVRPDLWVRYKDILPIVNSNEDGIYFDLKYLLENSSHLPMMQGKIKKYFKEVHSLNTVCQKLIHIYNDLEKDFNGNRGSMIIKALVDNSTKIDRQKRETTKNRTLLSKDLLVNNNQQVLDDEGSYLRLRRNFSLAVSQDVNGLHAEALSSYKMVAEFIAQFDDSIDDDRFVRVRKICEIRIRYLKEKLLNITAMH